jgi:exopolysaccharide biosynthesis polyprenyl glycosylphosphotransferase
MNPMQQSDLRLVQPGADPFDGSDRRAAPEARLELLQSRPRTPTARVLGGRGWLLTRLLTDTTLLLLAVLAARIGAPDRLSDDGQLVVWLMVPTVLVMLAVRGLYSNAIESRIIDTIGHVVSATSVAGIFLIGIVALVQPAAEPAAMLGRAWFFAILYLASGRILLGVLLRRARVARIVSKPTLILGAGAVGAEMEWRLREQPELGLKLIGYIDGNPPPAHKVPQRTAPVLGPPEDLVRIAQETGTEHVILAFSSTADRGLVPIVRQCEANGIQVSLVPRMYESLTKRLRFEQVGTLPLVGLHSVDPLGWQFMVKHVFDRVLAGVALLLLAPVMLAAAIAIKLESPGPVLFRQRRVGRDGRHFDILKFRSMAMPLHERGHAAVELPEGTAPGGVEGEDRRTRLGRLLRRSSIDELPQLFNVLKGDMSLVGPRPERPEFAALFAETLERYDDRHRVKSGITGWAQVKGLRGRTSLADRVRWDNYYIQNWSLNLDAKILLLTFAAVIREPGE